MDKVKEMQDRAADTENTDTDLDAKNASELRGLPTEAVGELGGNGIPSDSQEPTSAEPTPIRSQIELEAEISRLARRNQELEAGIPELVKEIQAAQANELAAWREAHNMRKIANELKNKLDEHNGHSHQHG